MFLREIYITVIHILQDYEILVDRGQVLYIVFHGQVDDKTERLNTDVNSICDSKHRGLQGSAIPVWVPGTSLGTSYIILRRVLCFGTVMV